MQHHDVITSEKNTNAIKIINTDAKVYCSSQAMASLPMKLMDRVLLGEDEPSCIGGAIDEQDILDILNCMLHKEENYVCHDYLESEGQVAAIRKPPKRDAIDESCRSKMCEWIFHVIDSTRLQRETAGVAMGYLDRFLCTEMPRAEQARCNRKEYQLAAMTCLYIAVKLQEPFEMDAHLMSRLSRGLHTAEEITTVEYDILIALQWKVNGPTSVQFVNYILKLLPDRSAVEALYEHSHFQTELAVGDYAFVPHIRQSTIAIASILNSLGGVEQGNLTSDECIQFVGAISNTFNLDIDSPLFNAVRGRLQESFAKSSGYELPQGPVPIPKQVPCNEKVNASEESPACVAKEMAFSLGDLLS